MDTFKSWATALACCALLQTGSALAGEAERRGLEISREAKLRDHGWGDFQADMEMVLKNEHGESSTRRMAIKTLEQEDDGDKSIIVFDYPRDVNGTVFLSFSHPSTSDEQWLYMPAIKRVKRISSSNKSGSFMGSEFSFEDLTSFEVEKYTYKLVDEETLNGANCWVIEQYPVDEHSGYLRRVVWVDKAEYRTQKVMFYDRNDRLLKTLEMSDYSQYLDKYWRAATFAVENHQTGKSTELFWTNYRFKTGLNDRDFNANTLHRAR